MSENNSFWKRLWKPWRSRDRGIGNLTSADTETIYHDYNFALRQMPKNQSSPSEVPQPYIPKCLGGIDVSSILSGESSPESYSYDHWLRNDLNSFGDFVAHTTNGNSVEDFVDTFAQSIDLSCIHHYDFDPEPNTLSDNCDYKNSILYQGNECFDDILDTFWNEGGLRDNESGDHDIERIMMSFESTYSSSISSRDSFQTAVSETLNMLNDVLEDHSDEIISQQCGLEPPPYSRDRITSNTSSLLSLPIPLEPPPSYWDLFGPKANHEMSDDYSFR